MRDVDQLAGQCALTLPALLVDALQTLVKSCDVQKEVKACGAWLCKAFVSIFTAASCFVETGCFV